MSSSDTYYSGGEHFGNLTIEGNRLKMTNAHTDKTTFDFSLENVAQCVLPQNNRNEVELQFQESDTRGVEDDNLVQVTFHFADKKISKKKTIKIEEDENGVTESSEKQEADKDDDDEDADTEAEVFHKSIVDTGIIKTLTGSVIVEFTSAQGTFVTPRGRYTIQVCII